MSIFIGWAYWLIVIDAFSRRVWARLLKRKSEDEVVTQFEDILQTMSGKTPARCRSDRGTEFRSRKFQKLMQDYDIKHSFPNVHAAIVEVRLT